jgi:hypothetical protein
MAMEQAQESTAFSADHRTADRWFDAEERWRSEYDPSVVHFGRYGPEEEALLASYLDQAPVQLSVYEMYVEDDRGEQFLERHQTVLVDRLVRRENGSYAWIGRIIVPELHRQPAYREIVFGSPEYDPATQTGALEFAIPRV